MRLQRRMGLRRPTFLGDDSGGGTGFPAVFRAYNFTADQTIVASIFAKAKQLDHLRIKTLNLSIAAEASFDLNSGVVADTGGSDFEDANITDCGDGWYRCELTFTPSGADLSGHVYFYSTDSSFGSVDRDGTSDIYIWGGQIEESDSGRATSYIPTSGSTASRAADSLYANVEGVFDSGGTVVCEYVSRGSNAESGASPFGAGSDSDATTALELKYNGNGDSYQARITSSGNPSCFINYEESVNAEYKSALRFATDDCVLYVNGSEEGTDYTAHIPQFDFLRVGSNKTGGKSLNAPIADLYWTSAQLTNAQLTTRTT